MKLRIYGNSFVVEYEANEDIQPLTLPDGYSYEQILITERTNIFAVNYNGISVNSILTFPPVNSLSPSTIKIDRINAADLTRLRFSILKFGQIPTTHYFDATFEPILVTGDGKEYNVIPSTQFK